MSADSPTTGPINWRGHVGPVPGEAAGRATIGPADLPVVDVLRRLAAGATDLDPTEVRACLNYAADVLAAVPAPPDAVATLPPAVEPAAAVTLPPALAQNVSHHVPGYDIVGELGRGGMGVVYQARQLGLNRTVALKMILAGGHAGAKERARFRAEAEAIARLQHPNIVQVYEVGEHDGLPFFSLEFVPGGTLAGQLARKPWAANRAAALVGTLAGAVHAAHTAGVIHRDLKPANVLLGADGTPKIADFGLAKRLESDGPTRTGEVMGTPEYMAPEQAAGRKDVGPAADVWALGAVLYELLTGRPPFHGSTPLDTILQVLEQELVPVRNLNRAVGRDLETVCWKCLQKDATQRYAGADELAADLRLFLDGEPIRAKTASFWRRLNHRVKRLPEFTSLGGAVGLILVVLVVCMREDWTICGCTALLATMTSARAAFRRTLVATAAACLVILALRPLVGLLNLELVSDAIPAALPWMLPPVVGLAAGVWGRVRGWMAIAYLVPTAILVGQTCWQLHSVGMSGLGAFLHDYMVMTAVSLVTGIYLGLLGRVMAWWVSGSILSAILGALGGMFIGGIVGSAGTVVIGIRFSSGSGNWAAPTLIGGCWLFGTIIGAFLGARRKRRRAG